MKYAISWVKAEFVPSKDWPHILPMLTRVKNRFSSLHKLISDNAQKFSGKIAKSWHKKHETRVLPIILHRLRNNGKIEQINDILKEIMLRAHLTHPDIPFADLLQNAINIHNRTPKSSGYSPYFLLYGTTPPDRTSHEAYTKENTPKEQDEFEKELAKHHEAPAAKA
jgi:hypothetical protein